MSSAVGDLVVVALGGVQRFIMESRTTADLSAASEMMAELARAAVQACDAHDDVTMIFPEHAEGVRGMPNRVVAIAPEGSGPPVAEAAAGAVRERWRAWVEECFGGLDGASPDTPGMPDVTWVSVPAARGDYRTQWRLAQRALAARRGVRDFAPVDEARRKLCSLSSRWVACAPPPSVRRHHRTEQLSRANWVKRQWGLLSQGPGGTRFPSTYAISSAAFRRAVGRHLDDPGVAAAVAELRRAVSALPRTRETAVPGLGALRDAGPLGGWLADSAGAWVYPDRWSPRTLRDVLADADDERPDSEVAELARRGGAAARALIEQMAAAPRGIPAPGDYLAVIAQDLDGMGEFLDGSGAARNGGTITVSAREHRSVSRKLLELGAAEAIELSRSDLLGVPVYAGGDDVLLFAPAATALAVAETAHRRVPGDLPTATTAVLFFHHGSPLRGAIGEVQTLLKKAKANVPGKHALAVGYLRRSGVRAYTIQPWSTPVAENAAAAFRPFIDEGAYPLSPRLVADLERDGDALRTLPDPVYAAELRRLVGRHIGGLRDDTRSEQVERVARALVELGVREQAVPQPDPPEPRPVPVARVGVFMRQECR